MTTAAGPRRLMIVVTEDWYFWSHRVGLARAARDAGWEVTVATQAGEFSDKIRAEGFHLAPLRMTRRQNNPLKELAAILQLAAVYRRVKPDVIHHVALKPAVYGSIAAMLGGMPRVVNMVAGLGGTFAGEGGRKAMARRVLEAAARVLFGNRRSRLIVQNRDDAAFFVDKGIVAADRVHRIPGSGVDCNHLTELPEADGTPVAALVARMLWSKGVGVIIEAARLLKARGVPLRLALVGRPDPHNPDSVSRDDLESWHAEGIVEWWGYCDDIRDVWSKAQIAVLPTTYGEGIPKSLIEAAACGRPIVTTDWPGCRDLVQTDRNGILIPPRDAGALADALERLATAPDERAAMGRAGRQVVEAGYTFDAVNKATLGVYETLLRDGEVHAAKQLQQEP